MATIDPTDVQGLVRFGRMTEACYLLLRICDGCGARLVCSGAGDHVGNSRTPPEVALQVAFTSATALRLAPDDIWRFSGVLSGMAGEEPVSVEISAPTRRGVAVGGSGSIPDVLVMFFSAGN